VELEDDYIQLGSVKESKFYSIGSYSKDILRRYDNIFGAVQLLLDAKQDTYQRTIFGFFDLTGQIGGLYEIFEVLGGLLVGHFAKKLFLFSLFSRIYKIERPLPSIDDSDISESNGINDSSSSNYKNDDGLEMDKMDEEPREESKMESKLNP
jgi:hypothetical protein